MKTTSIAQVKGGNFEAKDTPIGSYKFNGWIAFYLLTLLFALALAALYFRYKEKVHDKVKRAARRVTGRKKKR